jgi:L-ribulose-5-phosphate 3-epimerase
MVETGISTHAFAYNKLNEEIFGYISDSGFDAVELYMHKPHFDFESKKDLKNVSDAIRKFGLKANSIHCPFYRQIEEARKGKWLNITSSDETLRAESVRWIQKSIAAAEMIHFQFAVIHFGDINDRKPAGEKRTAALKSLLEIEPFAKSLGVRIVLENIPNDIASCAELNSFLNENNLTEKIGICFDTGHAAMAGEIPSGLIILKKMIKTVHLHDTIELKDEHLSAGDGILDWRLIVSHLKNSGYEGRLILENKYGNSPKETVIQAAKSAGMLKKLWESV